MMRIIAAALIVLGMSWPVAPLHARDVHRLKPVSKWVLDYAEDNCRLVRGFGEGHQRVSLMIDQLAPGDYFLVTFAGESLKPRRARGQISAELRFGPNEAVSKIEALEGKLGARTALFVPGTQRLAPLTEAEEAAQKKATKQRIAFEPAAIGEAREAAATWLELRKALPQDLVFETGPMNKPLAELRKCAWDMVSQWGLNVEQQKTLSRKPYQRRDHSTWLTSSDYPVGMIVRGQQAIVHVRVMVDSSGRPTSCHISRSTRPMEFGHIVCSKMIKNASFEPALDAQGNPVSSYWVQSVSFRIR